MPSSDPIAMAAAAAATAAAAGAAVHGIVDYAFGLVCNCEATRMVGTVPSKSNLHEEIVFGLERSSDSKTAKIGNPNK